MTGTTAAPDQVVFAVEHLTKRFGDSTAVEDLSFQIRRGVIAGFLGPNGAGKTTTIRALLGLVHPSEGVASVFGQPYRELPRPVTKWVLCSALPGSIRRVPHGSISRSWRPALE